MSYTKEQEVIVKKVLSSKGDYYKILAIERSSTDGEIKKAYRKLALKIHPDKNSHPSAPEAFKTASKAFEVLSDEGKRKIYDQTGQDPDSRQARAPQNPFGGRFPAAGGAQDFHFDGFDPDIFNLFFGANPGVNTFSFGPGGFNFQQAPRRRAAPRAAQPQQQGSFMSTFGQLLPVILLIGFSILTSFFGEHKQAAPEFSMSARKPYEYQRQTPNYKVTYYITKEKKDAAKLKDYIALDRVVEEQYIDRLNYKCIREKNRKVDMMSEARGLFFDDEELMKKAKSLATPHCDQLRSYGLI